MSAKNNAVTAPVTASTASVSIDFARYESDRKACAGLRKVAESLNTVDTFLNKAGVPLTEEQLHILRALNKLLSMSRIEDMREFGRDGAKFLK